MLRIWVRQNKVTKKESEMGNVWMKNSPYSSHFIPVSVFYLHRKAYMSESLTLSTATAGACLMHSLPLIHLEWVKFPEPQTAVT